VFASVSEYLVSSAAELYSANAIPFIFDVIKNIKLEIVRGTQTFSESNASALWMIWVNSWDKSCAV
jgi:hypothetical protein